MQKIKDALCRIKVVKIVKDKIRSHTYYRSDRVHYNRAQKDYKSKDYEAIMIAHSLEKGMSFDKARPFGKEKVKELMALFDKIDKDKKTAKEIVVNTLREYVDFYERHGWLEEPEYTSVKQFLAVNKNISRHKAGVETLSKKDVDAKTDYEKFLLSRHSIRNFSEKRLTKKDFEKAVHIARLTPTACNRQMVNVIFCESDSAKEAVISVIRKNLVGFNLDYATPIVVTFNTAAFSNPLERNQGWLNAGLFTMNLVNAMHSLGIASCICEFQQKPKREKALKKILHIKDNERIAVTIMAGYYRDENKVYVSQRLSSDELMRVE